MKSIVTLFFLCCFSIFGNSQIVKTTMTISTQYELEEGTINSIDSLTVDSIRITIDYLDETITVRENENGFSREITNNITYHYPQESGIYFKLESSINPVCAATINYNRTEYTLCEKSGDKNYFATNYQGDFVFIEELNIEYKNVYEAEFENNNAHLFNFGLLEGKWLKIGDTDTSEIEFIFNDNSYSLPSYCNDSIKVGLSGTQLYNVKGFGIKKQTFYVCVGTGSYVRLTLKDGCLIEEWLIRRLTESEIIVFTGQEVERLIKK